MGAIIAQRKQHKNTQAPRRSCLCSAGGTICLSISTGLIDSLILPSGSGRCGSLLGSCLPIDYGYFSATFLGRIEIEHQINPADTNASFWSFFEKRRTGSQNFYLSSNSMSLAIWSPFLMSSCFIYSSQYVSFMKRCFPVRTASSTRGVRSTWHSPMRSSLTIISLSHA